MLKNTSPGTEHKQKALDAAFKQTMKDMPFPIFSVASTGENETMRAVMVV